MSRTSSLKNTISKWTQGAWASGIAAPARCCSHVSHPPWLLTRLGQTRVSDLRSPSSFGPCMISIMETMVFVPELVQPLQSWGFFWGEIRHTNLCKRSLCALLDVRIGGGHLEASHTALVVGTWGRHVYRRIKYCEKCVILLSIVMHFQTGKHSTAWF